MKIELNQEINIDNIEEQRKLLLIIFNLILRKKIDNNEITEKLIKKINKTGGEDMLAILDAIEEENRRILNKGKREGKREGIKLEQKAIAKKLKQKSSSIEFIMEITELSKEEIENL